MKELACQRGVCKGGNCEQCADKFLHDAGLRHDGADP